MSRAPGVNCGESRSWTPLRLSCPWWQSKRWGTCWGRRGRALLSRHKYRQIQTNTDTIRDTSCWGKYQISLTYLFTFLLAGVPVLARDLFCYTYLVPVLVPVFLFPFSRSRFPFQFLTPIWKTRILKLFCPGEDTLGSESMIPIGPLLCRL